MGWSLITSTGSNQYKLRVKTGEHYDANGFGKIGDRYVIACTPTFGKIGDEIDLFWQMAESGDTWRYGDEKYVRCRLQ